MESLWVPAPTVCGVTTPAVLSLHPVPVVAAVVFRVCVCVCVHVCLPGPGGTVWLDSPGRFPRHGITRCPGTTSCRSVAVPYGASAAQVLFRAVLVWSRRGVPDGAVPTPFRSSSRCPEGFGDPHSGGAWPHGPERCHPHRPARLWPRRPPGAGPSTVGSIGAGGRRRAQGEFIAAGAGERRRETPGWAGGTAIPPPPCPTPGGAPAPRPCPPPSRGTAVPGAGGPGVCWGSWGRGSGGSWGVLQAGGAVPGVGGGGWRGGRQGGRGLGGLRGARGC